MNNLGKNNRAASVIAVILVFVLCFFAGFIHGRMNYKNLIALRACYPHEHIIKTVRYAPVTDVRLASAASPAQETTLDGTPFIVYGIGFLCFLGWGSIHRKKEHLPGSALGSESMARRAHAS
jgi:hypothetical protein